MSDSVSPDAFARLTGQRAFDSAFRIVSGETCRRKRQFRVGVAVSLRLRVRRHSHGFRGNRRLNAHPLRAGIRIIYDNLIDLHMVADRG